MSENIYHKPFMKKTILSFLCLLLFFRCTPQSEKTEAKTTIVKNVLSLSVSEKTANISNGLQSCRIGGHDYLASLNWLTNSLQLFDIQQEKLIDEIAFDIDGPNGAGRVFGAYVLNFDSILLFTQATNQVALTDTSGTIYSRIDYQPPAGLTNAFVMNAYFISYPVITGRQMIVKAHIEGNYREMTQELLSRYPLSYSIDLSTGKTTPGRATYPADYMPEGVKSFEYSMASDGEKLVYSFFGDHRLFYTGLADEQTLKEVKAASQYLPDKLPLFPVRGERVDTYKYLYASDRYESLLYDPYRQLFYRIAIPQADYQDEKKLLALRSAPRRFSILVLNRKLEVIAEYLTPDNTYLPQNIFVASRGLYLSACHPQNPDNREDLMRFDCLTVQLPE